MPPEGDGAGDATRRVLHWMLIGTRGGPMRARILDLLRQEPQNAHRIAQRLDVQYRTILHHLDVLVRNGLVIPVGEGYGREYFPSQWIAGHPQEFDGLLRQLGPGWRRAPRGEGGPPRP